MYESTIVELTTATSTKTKYAWKSVSVADLIYCLTGRRKSEHHRAYTYLTKVSASMISQAALAPQSSQSPSPTEPYGKLRNPAEPIRAHQRPIQSPTAPHGVRALRSLTEKGAHQRPAKPNGRRNQTAPYRAARSPKEPYGALRSPAEPIGAHQHPTEPISALRSPSAPYGALRSFTELTANKLVNKNTCM